MTVLGVWLIMGASCTPVVRTEDKNPDSQTALPFTVIADGESWQISSTAAIVGDVLEEANIHLSPFDEVVPKLSTSVLALEQDAPIVITVIRVTEALEVIPESIPYERRVVRSAEKSPNDPPRILQTGRAGLQEVSFRIVFHDGLEVERWPTATTVIEPAVDEIVMIGVGSDDQAMPITGRLAYINGGRAIILERSTDSPRQLAVDGQLDGRVFQLSPRGNYLLYTVSTIDKEDQTRFRNELWIVPTAEGGQPLNLQIENVLWAGWDPSALDPLRIAYGTARSVPLPPGWEANNDLWLLEPAFDGSQPSPVRLIETYPATYSWWGGNYAWSPTGETLAYAFADEVGLLDMSGLSLGEDSAGFTVQPEPVRTVLDKFVPFDTAADWAWVPSLSWSVDGQFLAFNEYVDDTGLFDLMMADIASTNITTLIEGSGIWSTTQWSPPTAPPDSRLVALRANDPTASDTSSYALWLVGNDGSLERRLYPLEGETGQFAHSNQTVSWGLDANSIAFIFDDELHILNLTTGEIYRAGLDDTISSHPTWAPYGAAAGR